MWNFLACNKMGSNIQSTMHELELSEEVLLDISTTSLYHQNLHPIKKNHLSQCNPTCFQALHCYNLESY